MRCVYITCHDNDTCIFTSSENGIELQVSMPNNPLQSSDNCTVNHVEIIHDCKPRLVDLILKFTPHSGDNRLYLQVAINLQHQTAVACVATYE